jgi:sulfur carrier protein
MHIILNGENTTITNNSTVQDLLNQFNLDLKKVAVEINKNLIQHCNFTTTTISNGDCIEIVHFIGGG